MSRPSCFSTEDFLHGTTCLIAEGGPGAATTAAILRRVGASAGSFYHRFPSRGQLLAELWLRLAEGYQRAFLDLLRAGDDTAAALFTPRWCRAHFLEARVLLLYSQRDFLAGDAPAECAARARKLAVELAEGLRAGARRRWGVDSEAAMGRMRFALVDLPLAAVRRFLKAGTPVPDWADDLVRDGCAALLGSLDAPGTARSEETE